MNLSKLTEILASSDKFKNKIDSIERSSYLSFKISYCFKASELSKDMGSFDDKENLLDDLKNDKEFERELKDLLIKFYQKKIDINKPQVNLITNFLEQNKEILKI